LIRSLASTPGIGFRWVSFRWLAIAIPLMA